MVLLPALSTIFALGSVITVMEPSSRSANSSSLTTTAAAAAAAATMRALEEASDADTSSGPMCNGNADPGPYSLDNYVCLAGTLKPNANEIQGADDATCCIASNACPYPERCAAGGGCLEGTAGIGCASCAPGWFQVGDGCVRCGSGSGRAATSIAAIVALITVVSMIWVLSRTQDAVENVMDNGSDLIEAGKVAKIISAQASYIGMTFLHVQITALAFQVPTIGYPVFLVRISAWIQSAFDMDLGQFLSSPECNVDVATLPITVLTYKLLTTMSIILMAAMVMVIVGRVTGETDHATNASIAVYTVGVSTVVNKCLRALDCVSGNLVSLPEQQCWQDGAVEYHAAAIIGIVLYCVFLPGVLLFKLRAGVIAYSDGNGDDEREEAEFQRKFGWCVLKYKPDSWAFELKLLLFKMVSMAIIVLLADGWLVLIGLTFVTGLLILDVWRRPPFRDGDEIEGWTELDKVQLFSLVTLVFGFALGAVSKLIGDVSGALGVILSLLGAASLVAPIIYAKVLARDTPVTERAPLVNTAASTEDIAERAANEGTENSTETTNPAAFENEAAT